MQRSDFFFELPPRLIARYPLPERSASRLLVCQPAGSALQLHDKTMQDFPAQLHAGDLVIFNDTRVIKARLYGRKPSGGKIEILVERPLTQTTALAHIRSNKKIRLNEQFLLPNNVSATVTAIGHGLFELTFNCPGLLEYLEEFGEIPLPPYFDRAPEAVDNERYQSIFASPQKAASAAAPTASLHFDPALVNQLTQRGINIAHVTLHVGAGTFQPVRSEKIEDHKMHHEWGEVPEATVQMIRKTRHAGKNVVAIGTTATRALESAARAQGGQLEQAWSGMTNIFIYPGYQFQVVDQLLTNFHLPESTLIMLVSAALGKDNTLVAYAHAIASQYRFFSYGDAMFLPTRFTGSNT